MNNSFCNCVFWFICCTMRLIRILLFLKASNVFQLICFFFEKFIYFFLIFNYSLSYYLSMFDNRTVSWISWSISSIFFWAIKNLWACRIRTSIFRFSYVWKITRRFNSIINFILFIKSLKIIACIRFIVFFQILWIFFSQLC